MRLSNGEMACLQLASRGLTSQEIAIESGYTVDTVNSYIKLSTRKLGVSNRIEAIAEGLRRRLIS
jgi:DNA-binding CsgD family transcriptional regulator